MHTLRHWESNLVKLAEDPPHVSTVRAMKGSGLICSQALLLGQLQGHTTSCTTSAYLHLWRASSDILQNRWDIQPSCLLGWLHHHTNKAQERTSHRTPAPEGLSAWWLLEPESALHLQWQAKTNVGSRQAQQQHRYLCFHLQLQTFLQQCQLNTKPWDAKHCLARLCGDDCDRLWLQLMLLRTAKVFGIE